MKKLDDIFIEFQNSPKSLEKFKQFIVAHFTLLQQEMLKDSTGEIEIPEIGPMVNDEVIKAVVRGNPRILYDFFDLNKVFVLISKYGPDFSVDINELPNSGDGYPSRLEAEIVGFIEAIKQLEIKNG